MKKKNRSGNSKNPLFKLNSMRRTPVAKQLINNESARTRTHTHTYSHQNDSKKISKKGVNALVLLKPMMFVLQFLLIG